MRQTITLAAAQTGLVLGKDVAPRIEAACALVREGATQGSDIICFPELLPTPFFPGRPRPDYERGRHRGRVCFRRDPSSGRRVDRSVAVDGFAATACPMRAAVRRRRALASALTARLLLRRRRP